MHANTHAYTPHTQLHPNTGWHMCIGCLQVQVFLRKRATNYRALLRNMAYKDKASYVSSPLTRSQQTLSASILPYMHSLSLSLCLCLFLSVSFSLSLSLCLFLSVSCSFSFSLYLSLSLSFCLSLSHTHTHTLSLSLTHTHTYTLQYIQPAVR